jgi:hypothetical protein
MDSGKAWENKLLEWRRSTRADLPLPEANQLSIGLTESRDSHSGFGAHLRANPFYGL